MASRPRVFQRGEKRCQTFRKVVCGNGKRRHHADAGDVAAFVFLKGGSCGSSVSCGFGTRRSISAIEPMPARKARCRGGEGFVFIVNLPEGFAGFVENLRQRHIHHRPARERQSERQYARVGRFENITSPLPNTVNNPAARAMPKAVIRLGKAISSMKIGSSVNVMPSG